MSIQLKKFNMNWIEFLPEENKGPVIVLIGRRDTGKSFLVKDLLHHHQDIPIGTVISGTEAGNHFYENMVPPRFIHEEYDTSIIFKLMQRQRQVLDEMREESKRTGRMSQFDPRAFLVMDDCLYDESWSRDKLVRAMFMNGRHWKLMVVITMQYPLGIPPNLRSQIDYIFILRENYIANKRRIYKNYAGMFPTFDSFVQVMDQCTENYECLVINNNVKSNKLTDQVFWYKAEPRADYRMGSREYWELGSIPEGDQQDDLDELISSRGASKPKISVRKTAW
jgi:hypothetical protein